MRPNGLYLRAAAPLDADGAMAFRAKMHSKWCLH